MCEEYHYEIHINDKFKNMQLDFPEFPNLHVVYNSSQDRLCPSNYSSTIRCFWEGDINLTLNVNKNIIILNDHDKRNNKVIKIGEYEFQGLYPLVNNKSRDEIYMIISIKKCIKK